MRMKDMVDMYIKLIFSSDRFGRKRITLLAVSIILLIDFSPVLD